MTDITEFLLHLEFGVIIGFFWGHFSGNAALREQLEDQAKIIKELKKKV